MSSRFLSSVAGQMSKRRPYPPRRALMYVPGSDERKLAKIPSLGADCICLDCEDGVAPSKKEEARNGIRKVLDGERSAFGNSERSVRVNSIESGLLGADLKVILGAKHLPDAIHLPKVHGIEDLRSFVREYNNAKSGRPDVKEEDTVGLILFIESAKGMVALPEICAAALELTSNTTNLVPEALVFGSDDFVADIGAVRTKGAEELIYARQKLVVVAKAFRLQAIDLVHIDYSDLEGLRAQSEEGARMGYNGKQVIHPGQIPVVHEAFAPSVEKIEWATELIKEFERQGLQKGRGAFNFRGSMIDMPLVRQAQNIVSMKDRLQ